MFTPIVCRNSAGGITHSWRIETEGERPMLALADAGGEAAFPLDDDQALSEAIRQLVALQALRRSKSFLPPSLRPEVVNPRIAAAMTRGM